MIHRTEQQSNVISVTLKSRQIHSITLCDCDGFAFDGVLLEDFDIMLNTETFDTFSNPWDIFELHRKEDIDKLRSEFNVTQLHFVATDGYTNHMRETVDQMDDRMYELYLKYHLAICERQDMVGYSHHTLDIFRKD